MAQGGLEIADGQVAPQLTRHIRHQRPGSARRLHAGQAERHVADVGELDGAARGRRDASRDDRDPTGGRCRGVRHRLGSMQLHTCRDGNRNGDDHDPEGRKPHPPKTTLLRPATLGAVGTPGLRHWDLLAREARRVLLLVVPLVVA